VSDAIKFPPMPEAEFSAKLARWNAIERGPKRNPGRRTTTYGKLVGLDFDEINARRRIARDAKQAEYRERVNKPTYPSSPTKWGEP
jgi:hypothetical protein